MVLFSNTMVDLLPALARTWWSRGWLYANASKGITSEWDFAHNAIDLRRYATNCPVVGANPSDYAPRLIVGNEGLVMLAGIRFRNLDLRQPFVDILGASRPFSSQSEINSCKEVVSTAFSVFAPHSIRIERSLLCEQFDGATPGKVVMAAPSDLMVANACPLPLGLSLKRARVSDVYAWYESAYRRFALRRPDLVPHVRQESRDDFGAAQDSGALFDILFEGQRIGLISAYESLEGPLDGLCINEFILDEAYLGRSLAVAAQGEFARQVHRIEPSVIYGNIHPSNGPALAVAEKLGRRAISQQTWIPLRRVKSEK